MPMLTMLLLTVSGAFLWSPLNCRHEEVDINTGRVRHTTYFLFCQIGDRTENTWVSRASSKSNRSPDWHRVNTFSPGVGHSPHYNFHGAIHQIATIERSENMVRFDPGARRKIADMLLMLWQNGGSDYDANEFVAEVARTAIQLHESGAMVLTESDVPAD